jgi:Leucine-rich repeat (LRR) protein
MLFDVYIATHIYAGIGEAFPNLEALNIGRFEGTIEFIEREDFANMEQLKELEIFNNPIRSISEDVFWDLPNLEALRIFKAQLKELPANLFANLRKLKEVSFYQNQLTHLDRDLFKNNLQLEEILFEDNRLTTIQVDFTMFPNIQEVNLLDNKCTNLEYSKTNSHFSLNDLQAVISWNCF